MLSYCLKCRKTQELSKQIKEKQSFCQKVQCVAVKKQDLLKS